MKPTMIRAGAVANEGTVRKIGERSRESANRAPVVIAVRPVRPPSAIPEVDSTKVVIVDVPSPAPTQSALDAREMSFLVQHVSLGCAADQSSQCVEDINEQE